MTDGNTHAIAQHLDEREDWDALQEVTAELEQAESDNILLIARIEELEAKLAKAVWDMKVLIDVSTLMQSSSTHNKFRHNTIVTDSIWAQWSKQLKSARTAFAKLEGETDE